MKLELPVRLEKPLYLCVLFIFISGFDSLDALGLGIWRYIIEIISFTIVIWLLGKSGLTEKEVPIWVGAFIIILGFTVGVILDTFVRNHI
ncbi:hypothetical protein RE628_20025 [Paenibacillus sp. D2_2]|uniref:hypothetical protein n=1 Tax=Paenibacillus sp. D2_2 TaxID=3073092 RepID=UPI002814A917|nr:hypothetical protein [Paenibacillus sp. D2_2]WMT39672.1 hypothetical protein RE628_20025 [Paenibacillus sp. D2_2]